jgi:hypothetical protein
MWHEENWAAKCDGVLFVGGTHDGRRIDVSPEILRRVIFMLPARGQKPTQTSRLEVETYHRRQVLNGRGSRCYLFVHEDVTDVMWALVQGYREAKGVGCG